MKFFLSIQIFIIFLSSVFSSLRGLTFKYLTVINGLNLTINYNCTTNADCNYNGNCMNNHQCKCNDGYITFDSETQCNYKQKNTLTAFLLELFIGMYTGAGYFYLELNYLALGQLFYFWGGILVFCFSSLCISSDFKIIIPILIFLWGIGIIMWWLYVVILIAKGTIRDNNGAPIPSL